MSDLGEFEGEDVLSVGIIVRGVGDGLSKAMEVAPEARKRGTWVTIAIRAKLDKIRFEGIKDTDGVKRVEDYVAETATVLVGNTAVEKALDRQQRTIQEHLPTGKGRTHSAEDGSE